jgi:hypothetical protein
MSSIDSFCTSYVIPVLVILFSFTFWDCSGHRAFSSAQLQEDESLYLKEINKRIELHTRNGDVINGYLTDVEDDSVGIGSKDDDPKPEKVAKTDVKYFYIYDESGVRSGAVWVAAYIMISVWLGLIAFQK